MDDMLEMQAKQKQVIHFMEHVISDFSILRCEISCHFSQ